MQSLVSKLLVVTMVVIATPCSAGLLDSTLTGAIPGMGGGGASFATTGTQMQNQVLVGLRSLTTAVALMQEASKNKVAADKLKAVADELKKATETKSDVAGAIERSATAINENPVDRKQLATVHDSKSKQQIVQSAGYMTVAGVYNAKAVDSARQLTSLRPGPADAMSAPSLLNTAKVVVSTVPTEVSHAASYSSMLVDYMKENKLAPPTKEDQLKAAQNEGASADDALSALKQ